MTGDGFEEMPLTELAEYEAYIEWRDTCCPTTQTPTSGVLSTSVPVDEALDRHLTDVLRTAMNDEGEA